jgi:H+/Cl- antiporter ClcA
MLAILADSLDSAPPLFSSDGGFMQIIISLLRFGFTSLNIEPVAFAVVGMAAFVTGVARAPLTRMLLVSELTGSVTMILPILGVCFLAMLIPRLLGNAPI